MSRQPGREREEPTELSPADRAFVERVAEAYTPEPMSPAERLAWNAALEERIARRRRRRPWLPALATALAAAGLLWVALPGLRETGSPIPDTRLEARSDVPAPAPLELARAQRPLAATSGGNAALRAASDWENGLLLAEDLPAAVGEAEEDAFPDEYDAIASLFLDLQV